MRSLSKHTTPVVAITLLLGACAFWLTSCAGNEVKDPQPPVTVLKTEPTPVPETNQAIPAFSTALQVNKNSGKPLSASKTIFIASPAAFIPIVPIDVKVNQNSWLDSKGLFWLLILLIMLVLLASAEQLRSNYRRKKLMTAKKAALPNDEILVQGPGMAELVKVPVKRGSPFHEIIASVASLGHFPAKKSFIFLEDEAVPLNPNHLLEAKNPLHKIYHVHPQKEIGVKAFFNGQEHQMHFSPATSIKKITAWASYQCELSNQNTSDVYLAIRGYSAPLIDTAHLGRYVEHDKNKLELDVMTLPRVNVTVSV